MANFRATTFLFVGLAALTGCDSFTPPDTGDPGEMIVCVRNDEEEPRARAPSAPLPPPPPARPVGDITVSIDPGDAFTGIEISECGYFRSRGLVVDGVAALRDIPLDGACKLNFKGGASGFSWREVNGGTAWACTLRDSALTCVPASPPSGTSEVGSG